MPSRLLLLFWLAAYYSLAHSLFRAALLIFVEGSYYFVKDLCLLDLIPRLLSFLDVPGATSYD